MFVPLTLEFYFDNVSIMFKYPWIFFLTILAGWVNRHQQAMIDYLHEENHILREKVGKKRIILNDDQRRRLAIKGKKLGRKLLREVCRVFEPDTVLKWHRQLVASKYDGSRNRRRPGRPPISREIEDLIVRMARENPDWGYLKIEGYLKYLGYQASRTTVKRVLIRRGFDPDPKIRKRTTWSQFIRTHWESLSAVDFFTVEVHTWNGLVRYMVLFAIDLCTRKVEIAGIVPQADGAWTEQMARNLTDPIDGFLKDKKYLIHDRDPCFTKKFDDILRAAGVEPKKMPKQSPNLNAFCERYVWSLKHECLNKMIVFGEKHLQYLIKNYVNHYLHSRPHQGLDNQFIAPLPQGRGKIITCERLGGLLKSYRREVA